MGCFNVPCGLSGLSISAGQPIIGFKVSQARHSQNRNSTFQPTSIPVVGKYNDYGGLVQDNGEVLNARPDSPAVFCHKELWDYVVEDGIKNISEWMFNKPVDNKTFLSLVKSIYDEQVAGFTEALNQNDGKDRPVIKEFLDDRPRMVIGAMSLTKTDGLHTYLLKGNSDFEALTQLVAKRIVDDNMLTDQECKYLEEMSHVYIHSFVTGRPVTPTSICYVTQDTDYKRINNWFRRIAKLATHYKRN